MCVCMAKTNKVRSSPLWDHHEVTVVRDTTKNCQLLKTNMIAVAVNEGCNYCGQ